MASAAKSWSERELFRSYWDDGLLDLLAGLALLLTGLGWQSPLGPLAVLQAPLWVALWIPLRRRWVEPRAGFVEFSRARRGTIRQNLSLALALGLGCLTLAAFALTWFSRRAPVPVEWDPVAGLPALIVAGGAAVAAALTGALRFLGYGALLVALAALAAVLAWHPAWPIAIAGSVVALSGSLWFRRFLRESRFYTDGR